MYISPSFIVALLGAPFLVLAQSDANPFNNPSGGYSATAGKPLTLSWKPTTDGTVSLILRSGNSGDLAEGTTIAGESCLTLTASCDATLTLERRWPFQLWFLHLERAKLYHSWQ